MPGVLLEIIIGVTNGSKAVLLVDGGSPSGIRVGILHPGEHVDVLLDMLGDPRIGFQLRVALDTEYLILDHILYWDIIR